MRLARQLELGSLVLFTDSKSVAKQLATMPASVAPCDGSQAHSPKRLAMDAAVALEAAGCRTSVHTAAQEAAAPQLLFDVQLHAALNGAFVVADRATGHAFAAQPGGTLACIEAATGSPCPKRPNVTIGPGGDFKLLGPMGRTEEDDGLTLLMGAGDLAFLVTWPDDDRQEPTAVQYSPAQIQAGWQSLNCTGTAGPAAASETTLACSMPLHGVNVLAGLTRGGALFKNEWASEVAPSLGLRILLAGLSVSPVLRQGGVWSPPELFGPALSYVSQPFGSDADHAAVLDAPEGPNALAGVAVSAGFRDHNAFAFAATAGDLPVLPSTRLPWTRALWPPCNGSIQASADSGRGVSAFAMSALGCVWGRKSACLTLLRTADGEPLWEACGADLTAAAGQSAPANVSSLRAVFAQGPVAPLTTVAALTTWEQPSPDLDPPAVPWQYGVLTLTLDPTAPPGRRAAPAPASLPLGGPPCRQADIQDLGAGVVAVLLSGCEGGTGARLVAPVVRYFAIRGKGEPIRVALTDLGVDFENHVVDFAAWPKIKAEGIADGSLPFTQLPAYADEDGKFGQMNGEVDFPSPRSD
ncbi:hypothetical protein FNF31_07322 [Cafeteria roenbergensis]|uniref:GST N-terminal domain-containing protein n=1 Tax=Cafeteria roenbergensis TaxID=33653 RepID=A0A5A8C7J1_CAFRO|nr:hypothetical protein FNF31_07322 [Cafeteria roenbergensis]